MNWECASCVRAYHRHSRLSRSVGWTVCPNQSPVNTNSFIDSTVFAYLCLFIKACWGWLYCRSTSAFKTSSHHRWIQVWPPHLFFLSVWRTLKYSPCVWKCEWCCKIHLPLANLHIWYDAVAYWFCYVGLCHELLMLCFTALLKLWLV